MTVIDDELTEGHELGSGMVGKLQGFYVTSSEDGSSQTIAFTAMYVNAKGYATLKTIINANQQTTDGEETLLEVTVYLTY
ncbi:PREDICTED: dirigent protein 10-like [Nelumbo nucifera]|nr:PREDICTED: dirigent protein 10-like [Nelumbo nucifera]